MNSNFDFSEAVKDIRKLKYNPYITNSRSKRKDNILKAERQQIPILTIYKDGLLLNYNIGNYRLSKNITNNLYTFDSISKLYDKKTIELIKKFLISQRFNYILHCFDNTIDIPQYIYFIKFADGVKVGRTFDLKQRYQPSTIYNMAVRIVEVNKVDKCEKEIKDKFKDFVSFITSSTTAAIATIGAIRIINIITVIEINMLFIMIITISVMVIIIFNRFLSIVISNIIIIIVSNRWLVVINMLFIMIVIVVFNRFLIVIVVNNFIVNNKFIIIATITFVFYLFAILISS